MRSTPLSIRFDPAILERLRRHARAGGTTPSGLAQRLVDEGLRVADHPGVTFRDGPSGRRAGLLHGPDVWEIISLIKRTDGQGDEVLHEVAESMSIEVAQVDIAIEYYGNYPTEIDDEIDDNDRAAETAFGAWQARQRLLA